ncbi:hypothetical protein [Leptolyngbya sp. FACHB-261]|uniref:hypothetical protein n=1 Tax=Leptolyngbya sp. FACHB-261 TaxID=2692806 RepID=UPI001686C1E3|nr:hypothetical protein [Leptolyngbya sp. FACHB-261]MBD2100768.1 hypothetical protein [Leptolyngbya sp. FACHB-261]
MSDSMAFLAGTAFAGIAALVFLKGGVSLGEATLPVARALQAPVEQPSLTTSLLTQTAGSQDLSALGDNLERQVKNQLEQQQTDIERVLQRQQTETERLKDLLDQQRTETDRLKLQIRDQQLALDTLTSQARAEALAGQVRPQQQTLSLPATATAEQSNNPVIPGVLWALGGMALTVTGGVVLAGVFSSLTQQQPRPARTMQVIHSINTPPAPTSLPPRRRTEVLPPRLDARSRDIIDHDRYSG